MNNVFKCPCCFSSYSKEINLPISLECGDVFCLPCIRSLISSSKEIICPIDGKRLIINLNSLITCKAILDFLPNKTKNKDVFYCKNHPEKKIKFSCETDNTAFCSLCFVIHKKHQVNTFHPSRQMINEQLLTMLKAIEDKNQTLIQKKDLFNQKKTCFEQRLKEEIDYVKHSTEKIINDVISQSNDFQLTLKEKYKKKIEKIDQFLIENSKYKSLVYSIENSIQSCLNAIKSKSNVNYDDISETKRAIVKKWEDFLLNYNITKIDMNKQQFLNEEKVVIDFRNIHNGKNIFSCKSLSIAHNNNSNSKDNKDHNDDNKEDTPIKSRQFTKVFQMSTNSTNVNSNNYSLKNQSQKENILKPRLSVLNQKRISNLNSLC